MILYITSDALKLFCREFGNFVNLPLLVQIFLAKNALSAIYLFVTAVHQTVSTVCIDQVVVIWSEYCDGVLAMFQL